MQNLRPLVISGVATKKHRHNAKRVLPICIAPADHRYGWLELWHNYRSKVAKIMTCYF